ncbi:MAG: polyribonucleotide nucleotidyltransferase [Myxococcales bacterium]|nr:polyribonucleotide nucleotidyltransferase [Myxococcales bacterium]
MYIKESIQIGGRELSIETGKMAKQADGSVVIRYGDTMVLVTAVANKSERAGVDFLPLTVEYVEKTAAAGKIPGGYFKREGRPTEKEVLTCRLIDRPSRPLFPKLWRCETQVIGMVLSYDKENPSDILAMTGASCALHVSDIPWAGPFAAVRVGRSSAAEGHKFIVNPTFAQSEASDLDLVVAATRDAIVMVEGGAAQLSEDIMIDALLFAHQAAQPLLDLIEKIRAAAGKEKRVYTAPVKDQSIAQRVKETALEKLRAAMSIKGKHERSETLSQLSTETVKILSSEFIQAAAEQAASASPLLRDKEISSAFGDLHKKAVREMVVNEGVRIDGRKTTDIRAISCEVGLIPRQHGSALFTRGETQALVSTTLGTAQDVQRIDSLLGDVTKRFMLHYNFPPFSTGEAKMMRSASRREVGHGYLAERSLARVLPAYEDFPYTIRIVSETLESNGSSSMAAVCGGCLSLMDAGVPILEPVAGIAMGLIKEGDKVAVLSDILGDEDHLGDMDFKVTGTKHGITALQMDIKIQGLSREILQKALHQAKDGRLHILGKMAEALGTPREELSKHAPRIFTLSIKPDRIRDVIGPGGKMIRAIIEQTGVAIDVEDDGTISIASSDDASAKKAIDIIKGLTTEPEIGQFYMGTVRRIVDFGAFVEILPGTDGLIHISELDAKRVNKVTDVLKEGDEVLVKVISVDRQGKIRLSRKEAIGATPEHIHNSK